MARSIWDLSSRDQTYVHAMEAWIFNHWITRGVPVSCILTHFQYITLLMTSLPVLRKTPVTMMEHGFGNDLGS